VIVEARRRLEQPLSLSELAEMAWLSPYHFNRVFRQTTAVSPFHFLAALRMEAAKRLLLTTDLSVTDICFSVGYQSLGSFTTHFGRFVGLPPTRLRVLPLERIRDTMEALRERPDAAPPNPDHGLSGYVASRDGFSGPTFTGLFTTPIPQQRPVACCLLNSPGAYHLPHIPDGVYYAVAAAFEWSSDPLDYLLPDAGQIRIGVGDSPVAVAGGRSLRPVNIELRPPRLIDPPILIALPLLLAEHRACGRISV
jgi:AraC-like DNA-binding protein